jgi:nicotinate-nucleotide adenylyltransferase
MAHAAAAEYPTLGVLDWEVAAEGPSYTVRTLGWLRERLGEVPVITIMGSDAFVKLDQWHRWPELLARGSIAVVRRPGTELAGMSDELQSALAGRWCQRPGELLAAPAGRVAALEVTRLDISATAVRGLVSAGRSPRFLVPGSVEAHIHGAGLYANP